MTDQKKNGNMIVMIALGAVAVLAGVYFFTDAFKQKESVSVSFGGQTLSIETE